MFSKVVEDSNGRRVAEDPCTEPCAIERGMQVIRGKWTGSILWHLKDGPVRFNDLTRMVNGASRKMVADRLKQLEKQGLVHRQVINSAPVSVEYSATSHGTQAIAFLDDLRKWSEDLPAQDKAVD